MGVYLVAAWVSSISGSFYEFGTLYEGSLWICVWGIPFTTIVSILLPIIIPMTPGDLELSLLAFAGGASSTWLGRSAYGSTPIMETSGAPTEVTIDE